MSYGAGTITFERGRYRLRIPDGKGGYKSAGTFATYEDAARMRDVLLLERGEAPAGSVSLCDYGERVIERWVRAGHRDAKSLRSRWSAIVCRAPFADSPVATLTRSEVRDWARALPVQLSARGLPLSWQSQRHALGLLCRVLDEAREDGVIEVNPARGVKLQRRQERAESWTWLTLAEIEAVLALPLSLEVRTAIALAVYQGLRQGEIAGLSWSNVDLDGAWLVVAASWTTATKSGRVRRIPLLRPAAEALRAWRPDPDTRTGLVFPGPDGKCYARGYDWGWGDRRNERDDIPTQAGIKRRVRFHDLRHTCAAHLVSGSWGRAWRLREARDFLGHTTEAVTERYAHLAPDALHATARATAAGPAANPPQEVGAAAAQVLDFVRRAMRDSNARPSAPEAQDSFAVAHGCDDPRQVRGRSIAQSVLEAARDGRGVAQADLDELAAAALGGPLALRALAALAGGPDALAAGLDLAGALLAAAQAPDAEAAG